MRSCSRVAVALLLQFSHAICTHTRWQPAWHSRLPAASLMLRAWCALSFAVARTGASRGRKRARSWMEALARSHWHGSTPNASGTVTVRALRTSSVAFASQAYFTIL